MDNDVTDATKRDLGCLPMSAFDIHASRSFCSNAYNLQFAAFPRSLRGSGSGTTRSKKVAIEVPQTARSGLPDQMDAKREFESTCPCKLFRVMFCAENVCLLQLPGL